MNEVSTLRLWMMRGLFAGLALVLLVSALLPLQTLPRSVAGPDLLLCMTFAWVIRRPEYVPIWLAALLFLLADFLLGRPPGLMAALVVMASTDLGTRTRSLRDAGFGAEWGRVALYVVIIALVQRLVPAVLLVEVPGLVLSATQALFTILVYPLVVAVNAVLLGIKMTAPGDLDAIGQRQ